MEITPNLQHLFDVCKELKNDARHAPQTTNDACESLEQLAHQNEELIRKIRGQIGENGE